MWLLSFLRSDAEPPTLPPSSARRRRRTSGGGVAVRLQRPGAPGGDPVRCVAGPRRSRAVDPAVISAKVASISASVLAGAWWLWDSVTPTWRRWHSSRRLAGSELSPLMWSISVPGEEHRPHRPIGIRDLVDDRHSARTLTDVSGRRLRTNCFVNSRSLATV